MACVERKRQECFDYELSTAPERPAMLRRKKSGGKPDNNKGGRLTAWRESDALIVLGEWVSHLQGEGVHAARSMHRNRESAGRYESSQKNPTSVCKQTEDPRCKPHCME